MNKYIAIALILLIIGVMVTFYCCISFGDFDDSGDNMPASWGKYKIESVANEPLLSRLYPECGTSECGLSDDDFIKYARDRIDRRRQFQFIVFIEGKPLVGEKCLRKAFLFYLK